MDHPGETTKFKRIKPRSCKFYVGGGIHLIRITFEIRFYVEKIQKSCKMLHYATEDGPQICFPRVNTPSCNSLSLAMGTFTFYVPSVSTFCGLYVLW